MLDLLVQKFSLFFTFNQNNVFEVLLILMTLIWASGNLFRRFKLPLMLGELIAGILLGPAILGLMEDTEIIHTLAELGVFFMLLHSGLESDPVKLMKNSHFSILTAVSSVIVSLLAGYGICRYLGYGLETALFVGTILSFTSIAIVHNSLKSLKIHTHQVGQILQSTVLVNDLISFLLFSVVASLLREGGFSLSTLGWTIGKVALFFILTLSLGYKILPKFSKIFNTVGMKGFTFTLVVALFFGLIAEKIGLHVVLGAYLAGIFIRQNVGEERLYHKIEDRVFGLSYSFLGPIFFALIGLNISFEVLFSQEIYIFLILLITAILSKFLVGFVASLFYPKTTYRDSVAIGLGLIARGEMVLILANIGFGQTLNINQGLIDKTLFSSLILIVFCTTLIMPLGLKFLAGYKGEKFTFL